VTVHVHTWPRNFHGNNWAGSGRWEASAAYAGRNAH
jgi:hypothetical protein